MFESDEIFGVAERIAAGATECVVCREPLGALGDRYVDMTQYVVSGHADVICVDCDELARDVYCA